MVSYKEVIARANIQWSSCKVCFSLTKTVNGKCVKCGAVKE